MKTKHGTYQFSLLGLVRIKVYPIDQNKHSIKKRKYSQNIYLLILKNEQTGDELQESVLLY
mgnify:FL=1